MTKCVYERFRKFISIDTNTDCHVWTGGKDPDGYGIFSIHGKSVRVHRWFWKFINKTSLLKKEHVLHKCDNPSCVYINHLFIGTNIDNMRDRNEKERQAKHQQNGQAKLTQKDVDFIRSSSLSNPELGKLFNMCRGTMWRIKTYKLWK